MPLLFKFCLIQFCKYFDYETTSSLQCHKLIAGIWGSAFCILFKRILDDNRRLDPVEMIRQEMGEYS